LLSVLAASYLGSLVETGVIAGRRVPVPVAALASVACAVPIYHGVRPATDHDQGELSGKRWPSAAERPHTIRGDARSR
jgi:hypothetical protein